jgi:hypothetical protein
VKARALLCIALGTRESSVTHDCIPLILNGEEWPKHTLANVALSAAQVKRIGAAERSYGPRLIPNPLKHWVFIHETQPLLSNSSNSSWKAEGSIANPRSRHAEAHDLDFELSEFNGASEA